MHFNVNISFIFKRRITAEERAKRLDQERRANAARRHNDFLTYVSRNMSLSFREIGFVSHVLFSFVIVLNNKAIHMILSTTLAGSKFTKQYLPII